MCKTFYYWCHCIKTYYFLHMLILSIFPQIATRVMGIKVSQLFCYHRHQYPVQPNHSCWSAMQLRGPDWSLVNTILLEDWMNGSAERYGFDIFEEYCSNFKVHKKTWSRFRITHNDFNQKETKLCSFPCVVAETGREEHISWRVKSATVLALSDQIVVTQVVVTRVVKIFVADWHKDILLGTYILPYKDEPCLQECFISPDSRMLLLRENSQLRCFLRHRGYISPNISVIKIEEGLCKKLYVIRDSLCHGCYGSGFSFDPTYESRIVIISSAYQSVELDNCHEGCHKYDLKSRETIVMRSACTTGIIDHIRYSPNGQYLAVLCVDVEMGGRFDIPIVSDEHVKLLCGITLSAITVLSKAMELGPCFVTNIHMFPTFSKDSSFIAQIDSTEGCSVRVHFVPSSSMFDTLKEAARRVILRQVQKRYIRELPLPQQMTDYLLFRNGVLQSPPVIHGDEFIDRLSLRWIIRQTNHDGYHCRSWSVIF